MNRYVLLSKSGRHTMEVVGTSFYPDGDREIVGQARSENGTLSADWNTVFELVPEPDNPYDDHAVSVRHRGVLVGYIPREKNRPWWSSLTNVVVNGAVPAAHGKVEFWGDDSDPSYSISLQMANPKYAMSGFSGAIPVKCGGNEVPPAYGTGAKSAPSAPGSVQRTAASNGGCGTAAVLIVLAGVLLIAL